MKIDAANQQITDYILNELENTDTTKKGWSCPWHNLTSTACPSNAITGNDYNGINILNLSLVAMARGYSSNLWAGFKQWKTKGACVKKGEKGTPVIFAKPVPSKEDENKFFFIYKVSYVWNASQVEGFTAPQSASLTLEDKVKTLANVEAFVSNTKAHIRHGEGGAYYVPSYDLINMPERKTFRNDNGHDATHGYYATLLHELTHWTGHKSRLDRLQKGVVKGSASYAFEELIAELGAAFLCQKLGITNEPRHDHVNYLASWIKALKNDKSFLIKAAAKADKAVKFMTELQGEAEKTEAA